MVGSDGGIRSASWDQNTGWTDWSRVADGTALPGSVLTTAVGGAGPLHLLVTMGDGRIVATSRPPNGAWTGWNEFAGRAAAAGPSLAAVAREANHVDLFAAGANGSISCISWNAASGRGSWLDLAGRTAAVGSASTAVARDQESRRLFHDRRGQRGSLHHMGREPELMGQLGRSWRNERPSGIPAQRERLGLRSPGANRLYGNSRPYAPNAGEPVGCGGRLARVDARRLTSGKHALN